MLRYYIGSCNHVALFQRKALALKLLSKLRKVLISVNLKIISHEFLLISAD